MEQQHQNGSVSKHTINDLKKALAQQQYTRAVLIHTRRIQAFISRYNKIQRYIQRSIAYLCIVILPYTALKYIIFALRMKRHYSKIESYDLICFFPSSFFFSLLSRFVLCMRHPIQCYQLLYAASPSVICEWFLRFFCFLFASIEHVTFEYQPNSAARMCANRELTYRVVVLLYALGDLQ